MVNIESKLWKISGAYSTFNLTVIQKASGASRLVARGSLPSLEALSAMHERKFDSACREAFHNAAQYPMGRRE